MQILHNIDFPIDIYEDLKKYIKEEKCIETSQKGIHFGNYCLINIPDDMIEEIKQRFPKIQYRNKKTIMEKEDLDYKEGEKLTLEYLETDFFPIHNQKVTVYKNNYLNGELVVRAYRSKAKGWRIYEGDNALLKKGW